MSGRLWQQHGFLGISLILLVLIALGAGWHFWPSGTLDSAPDRSVAVMRRPIELDVRERGILRPARVVPVQSEIMSNQARVIWLHEEGRFVNQGLVVARFDIKPFMDVLARTEQGVADAEARLEAAQKAVELLQEDAAVKIENATRNLEMARLRADDLRYGAGQLDRARVVQAVEKADRYLNLAQRELEDFDVLLQRGHVSQRERDNAANRLQNAIEDVSVARSRLANFERYEWPRRLREAEAVVESAEMELTRVKRMADMDRRRGQDEIERQRRALTQAEVAFEQARRDVENCDVHAPSSGVLLYREMLRSDGRRKIRIGDDVWMGQAFMEIPDTSALIVEVHVREVDIAKLAPGMEATVRLDALPNRHFPAQVEAIDPVAEADAAHAGLRRFPVRVRLLEADSDMHSGMSAEVRMIYRRAPNALVIPLTALMFQEEKPVVQVRQNSTLILQPVVIGAMGSTWVEILEGLSEGQLVETRRL